MIEIKRLVNRKLVINCCNDCPRFDNDYYDFIATCTKLDRKIEEVLGFHPMPSDCPLEATEEEVTGD